MNTFVHRLKSSVLRGAWASGEFVHRQFDAHSKESRRESASPLPESASSGQAAPSYFYVQTDQVPLKPKPVSGIANPILTAEDVYDYKNVDFVADPFLFPSDTGGWHLFFEIYNRDRRPTAVIGHATTEDAGRSWQYDGIVLQTDVHLAFPYVFKWDGEFYMIPDRWVKNNPADIRIYRTSSLPDGWQPVSVIVDPDRQLTDCVVFRWNNQWWAMLGSDDGCYELHLYHSKNLHTSSWTPHERNPVVTGRPEAARPAGRPLVGDDRITVFFQDCVKQYGHRVRAFDIEQLSSTTYADYERQESPILEASDRWFGWNSGRMHHIDPWYTVDGWRCAVDGNIGVGQHVFGPDHWAIGMYEF